MYENRSSTTFDDELITVSYRTNKLSKCTWNYRSICNEVRIKPSIQSLSHGRECENRRTISESTETYQNKQGIELPSIIAEFQ